LVDPERAAARLERVRKLIAELDQIHAEGEATYLAENQVRLRMAAERALELAIQICIDLGTQLLMESPARAPENYADVFKAMAEADLLPADLAKRLEEAAKQRNLLVHLYMEIDDRKVFASLESLDDLRQFAEIVGRELD
jgi:uncharacterized protein YutE (UPF0331/DUF86 family)